MMKLILLGAAMLLAATSTTAQHSATSSASNSLPFAATSSFGSSGSFGIAAPFASSGRPSSSLGGFSGDACQPTPCGPNTRCTVNRSGIAQCRCQDSFVPDGHTINGCKPQCVSSNECPNEYTCRATKCVRACEPGACGIDADCKASNHFATCTCPQGYQGDANTRCIRIRNEPPAPIPREPVNPCVPNPCGTSAECTVRGDRPVCTCPIGYEGDPLTNCRRGECIETRDCRDNQVCQSLRCIDPCTIQPSLCGQQAECRTSNHQPICSCPARYVGNPLDRCTPFDPRTLCEPTPCGANTQCRVDQVQERAVCSCIDNYIGDPLTGCRPECVSDNECPDSQGCRNNRCTNPCVSGCAQGAYCDVRNHRAVCSCPEFYQGDAYSGGCRAECTSHEECRSFQACYQFRCVDPCQGACGTGAQCKVDNHKPICSCPKGYTGHPFESCRPFTSRDLCEPNPCGREALCTPGQDSTGNQRPVCTCAEGYIGNPLSSCTRGECTSHNECPNHQACYQYTCQSPCVTDLGSVCGTSAECQVRNHQPVCSCPQGYTGDPLTSCSPRSVVGFNSGNSFNNRLHSGK